MMMELMQLVKYVQTGAQLVQIRIHAHIVLKTEKEPPIVVVYLDILS